MRRRLAVALVLAVGFPACERTVAAHANALEAGSSVSNETSRVARVPDFAPSHGPTCPKAGRKACAGRWAGVARDAGWPRRLIPWLTCIIWRESAGNPKAWNRGDGGRYEGSKGLMQILWIHVPWLRRAGVIRTSADLFNPWRNLRAAWLLYQRQPGAWASTTRGC